MNEIKEVEKQVNEANTIEALKSLEPTLHEMRISRSRMFATEDSKAIRDELMDEMFEIKQIQGHLASKCMTIARSKIKKPRF